jgi:hypothetical protein
MSISSMDPLTATSAGRTWGEVVFDIIFQRQHSMSIFVGEVLADGIVFAADKNVTISRIDDTGRVISTVQDLGSKILRWPKHKALLGYVGCAQIGSKTMHDWLYDFMGEHIAFTEPAVVAHDMRDRLQRSIGGPNAPTCIVEFATFCKREEHVVPEFWHITNIHGLTATGYQPPLRNIRCFRAVAGRSSEGHWSRASEYSRLPA